MGSARTKKDETLGVLQKGVGNGAELLVDGVGIVGGATKDIALGVGGATIDLATGAGDFAKENLEMID